MKKIMTTIAALALGAAVFTGCAKKSTKLELYYYKQENQEGLKKIVKAFEQANPGVTVDMIILPNDGDAAMSARAASGTLPDILQMQGYARVREYASKGYLEDLSNEEALTKVTPSTLKSVTYQGKQYGIPMDLAGIGIIYNKALFTKYGVKVPETYKELQEACAKFQNAGIAPFAGLLKENWSVGHFITLVHTALLSEKNIEPEQFVADMNEGKSSYGVVDTAKLFNILTFYKDNMNKNAAETDGTGQQQIFAKGEAAMMVQGLWAYGPAKEINPELDAGFIPFPVFNDASKNKLLADVDSTFVVSSQSSNEKKALAKKFVNWLTSEEGRKLWLNEYKLVPPFKNMDASALGGPFADLSKSTDEKGSYPWAFSWYPSDVFENACKNGAQAYMMGKTNSSDVINKIDETWKASVNK